MFTKLSSGLARALFVSIASATAAVSLACSSDAGVEPSTSRSVESAADADSVQARRGGPEVALRVTEAPPFNGHYRTFDNSGTAAVRVSVVSLNGGVLTARAQRGGGGHSIRTPRFNPNTGAPRAVVKILNATATDALNPRTNPFTFGADFTLDGLSSSTARGSVDNGDNLMQRGLFNDSSQYKLELDDNVAACRIGGAQGAVEVSSSVRMQADRWYRARCKRLSGSISISVTFWRANGSAHTVTDTRAGRTGDMTPDRASWPLSVGGKLEAAGAVSSATDQFNGRIDNAILRIR